MPQEKLTGITVLFRLAAYGAQKIDGMWSYQLLICLQFAFVLVLVVGYPLFPESPYWCLKTGKDEKARKNLARAHGAFNVSLIEAEMTRIREEVRVSEEMKALAAQTGPPLLQCFKGTNIQRTLVACLPAAAQQLIGAAFVLGQSCGIWFLSRVSLTTT